MEYVGNSNLGLDGPIQNPLTLSFVCFPYGPKRPHEHKDLTFWFQGPIYGGYQKPWFVGSLCLCGLLGP